MGGIIDGPILRFKFDIPSAQQAARTITKNMQSQFQAAGKQSAAAFVDPLIAKAAKLRAITAGALKPEGEVMNMRKSLVSSLEKEITLRTRNSAATAKDLATLKKYTMELERQKSFIAGTGGLTTGTRNAIGSFQNSLQTMLKQAISGISARAGSYGGSFGSFAGLRINEPLGKFAEEAAGLNLALLGTGTAAVAATAALIGLAKRGAEFAVSMRNAAEASGISIKSAVELRSVSKVLGIDFDTVSTSFRKFDREITLATQASLPHASYEAVRAGKIFEALGVNVAQAAKDPAEGMAQLSQALSKLPDGAVKSAVEIELLGRGGREAAPLLNHFAEALAATKNTSDTLADKIGGAAKVGDTLAATTANLSNQWHILETSLATVFVPMLTDIIGLVNKGFSSGSNFFQLPGPHVPRDLNGNPIVIPQGDAKAAAAAMAGAAVSLGKNPGALQAPDALKKAAEALAMDSTGKGRGGRSQDFSEPLFLGTALEREWTKYQEAIVKSNEALKKHTQLMEKLSADTFAKNSFMTMMLGPIGIAADSPDKTGAGIQKLFDKMNEKNAETAKKAADEWTRQFEKLKESVGGLFDSMLQGSRSFADALKRMVETALLAPIKNIFTTQIARLLQGLETRVQKSATSSKGSHGVGGFFSKILNALGLGGTPAAQPIAQQNVGTLIANSLTVLGGTTAATAAQLPKPSNFLDMFSGGSSLSSLAGVGGLSLALAGAGGMAIAGSGGSPIAAAGGVISSSGSGGILGSLQNTAKAMAANPLKTGIGGALLLGAGIASHNGAAMALGIGSLAGAGLTELSKLLPLQGGGLGTAKMPSRLAGVLGVLGQAAPGIGMMFAGNQTGGLGGAAMGALGGAEAGAVIGTAFMPGIGTAIGAGIGAIAGGIMGIFGKKDNTKAWNNGVQKAINNQRITQPLSENFAFAATNAMASTFGTTFSQGPGGFSNSTLPANTPFWANAILGTPHGTSATIAWNALMNGMNPNSPFFGGTNTSPFNGGPLVNGLRLPGPPTGAFSPNAAAAPMSVAPSVVVHLTIPGYVDKNGVADIAKAITPHIQKAFNGSIYQGSTGAWKTIRRAGQLP